MSRKKENFFIVTGPTACGKSDVALHIAAHLDKGSIISADSMQVYRGMDIGTAKAPADVREEIPHYLIDVVDPWESYSLGRYIEDLQCVAARLNNCNIPLLIAGGTGLYIRGIIYGVFEGPAADWDFRSQLETIAHEKGSSHLHGMLKEVDPATAARVHPQDKLRIIRAIEVHKITGATITELQMQSHRRKREQELDYSIFVINRPKDSLHKRIDDRVDAMIEDGFVDEVSALRQAANGMSRQARQALGYKEILRHLDNEIDIECAKALIKHNTKRFAKRQMTWFKSFDNVSWMETSQGDDHRTIGNQVLDVIDKHR